MKDGFGILSAFVLIIRVLPFDELLEHDNIGTLCVSHTLACLG